MCSEKHPAETFPELQKCTPETYGTAEQFSSRRKCRKESEKWRVTSCTKGKTTLNKPNPTPTSFPITSPLHSSTVCTVKVVSCQNTQAIKLSMSHTAYGSLNLVYSYVSKVKTGPALAEVSLQVQSSLPLLRQWFCQTCRTKKKCRDVSLVKTAQGLTVTSLMVCISVYDCDFGMRP